MIRTIVVQIFHVTNARSLIKKKERKKLPFSLNIDLDKANSRSRFTFRFSINTGEEIYIYIYIFLSPEIIIRIYSRDHVDKFTFYDKSESAISVNQSEKKKWLGFEKVSNLGKCCTNLVRYGFILQPLDNPYTLFRSHGQSDGEIWNSKLPECIYIYIYTYARFGRCDLRFRSETVSKIQSHPLYRRAGR